MRFFLLALAISVLSAVYPVSAQTTSTVTYTATADTYVAGAYPTRNYGSATTLQTDTDPQKAILLKFLLPNLSGQTVQSAKLRLYSVGSSNLGGKVFLTASSSWTETAVNWNTAPAVAGNQLAAFSAVAASRWYEVNIPPAAITSGTLSLRINPASTDGADYSSRQGANSPQLVVTLSTSSPTATPTPRPPTATPIPPTPTSVPGGGGLPGELTAQICPAGSCHTLPCPSGTVYQSPVLYTCSQAGEYCCLPPTPTPPPSCYSGVYSCDQLSPPRTNTHCASGCSGSQVCCGVQISNYFTCLPGITRCFMPPTGSTDPAYTQVCKSDGTGWDLATKQNCAQGYICNKEYDSCEAPPRISIAGCPELSTVCLNGIKYRCLFGGYLEIKGDTTCPAPPPPAPPIPGHCCSSGLSPAQAVSCATNYDTSYSSCINAPSPGCQWTCAIPNRTYGDCRKIPGFNFYACMQDDLLWAKMLMPGGRKNGDLTDCTMERKGCTIAAACNVLCNFVDDKYCNLARCIDNNPILNYTECDYHNMNNVYKALRGFDPFFSITKIEPDYYEPLLKRRAVSRATINDALLNGPVLVSMRYHDPNIHTNVLGDHATIIIGRDPVTGKYHMAESSLRVYEDSMIDENNFFLTFSYAYSIIPVRR